MAYPKFDILQPLDRLLFLPDRGHLMGLPSNPGITCAAGTGVPTNGTQGWAPGAIFLNFLSTGQGKTQFYTNSGTFKSSIWTPVGPSVDYSIGASPFRYDWVNYPPTITASADESTVTVKSSQVTLTMLRPRNINGNRSEPWVYTTSGTTWWVSPSGNDTVNNGQSVGSPFKTIAHAYSRAVAGDIIYLLPGTYSEAVTFPTGGTAGNPIRISCAPVANGGGLFTVLWHPPVSLTLTTFAAAYLSTSSSSYITFNGIIFRGQIGDPGWPPFTGQSTYLGHGVFLDSGAGTGIIVQNCALWNHQATGVKEDGDNGNGFSLLSNLIFANGTSGLDHGMYLASDGPDTVSGNIIWSNAGIGINIFSSSGGTAGANITIKNNLSFGNATSGILSPGNPANIQLNTSSYNGGQGLYYWGTLYSLNVDHNVFCFNGSHGENADTAPSGGTIDFNCVFGNTNGNYHAGGAFSLQGAHDVNSDPLFNSPLTGDFTLQAGSPAAGMGCY